MRRIPFSEAHGILTRILRQYGYADEQAVLSARLFCESNRDGVLSHGLARFSNLVSAIGSGKVDPSAEPLMEWSGGALERWNGNQGPGDLNARFSMQRAVRLSDDYGVGCVALSNTNHWMRGGNFGWQAVDAGRIGICWTNTMPNLPPWGSAHPLVGNNPLVIGIPRHDGPIVLDMAMSQFSYGALSRYSKVGNELPVDGGFDANGVLTRDPASILESVRPLPIGFWKGSGLSIVLDLMAALLSGGRATCDIAPNPGAETSISQVFLAFSVPGSPGLADRVIESLRVAGEDVRYPGERTLNSRRESEKLGIPVEDAVWNDIKGLASFSSE